MIANFPDYFNTVRISPDECQFSRLFQNGPDFPSWLPIFRIISKLSGFFQMNANFTDDFKTVGFFQMTSNFPDDFKTVRIFPDECQFSGWFQNCPYWLTDWGGARTFITASLAMSWEAKALFRLVVRNDFTHFVRKVFARRKLLPGMLWVFAPLVFNIKSRT